MFNGRKGAWFVARMKNFLKKIFFDVDLKKILNFEHASFDVFDTLIVRKCRMPVIVFDLVEDRYNKMGRGIIANFRDMRVKAEAMLRSNRAEVTLNDIYESLQGVLGREKSLVLKDLEIETELDQCVANKRVVDFYNEFVQKNDAMIISDMYLPASIIGEILKKNAIETPSKIYVSCEYGKTKRNRKLFEHVLSERSLNCKDVIHVGDNFISDYRNPRKVGMHSCLIVE